MADFEVYMVSIEWKKENKPFRIEKAARPLKISHEYANRYEYDAIIYDKQGNSTSNFYQISIETPYFAYVKEGKNWKKLDKIQENLWIIKGEWAKSQNGKGYHKCPSINTAGEIEICIFKNGLVEDYFINIEISVNIEGFDFEQLKTDFEGDLWNLITTKKSKLQINRQEENNRKERFTFPENNLIKDFLKVFLAIAQNPKKELIATQNLVRLEKVKPIAATYRALAKTGKNIGLPSKSFAENIDIYENRLVCSFLYKISKIIKGNITHNPKKINSLQKLSDAKQNDIKKLSKDTISANKEELLANIAELEDYICNWKPNWEKEKDNLNFPSDADRFEEIEIQFPNAYDNGYYLVTKVQNGNTDFCYVSFCDREILVFEPQIGLKLSMMVSIKKLEMLKKKNSYWVSAIQKGSIKFISKSEKEEKRLEKLKTSYEIEEERNWERQLSNREREQRDNQIHTQENTIVPLNNELGNLTQYIEEQKNLNQEIEKCLQMPFFKEIAWQKAKSYKPSMTFIQNMKYKTARGLYREIENSEGIDFDTLEMYEKCMKYGVKDMPQVYELWCLISIIKILEETYHFKHKKNDLKHLLTIVNPEAKRFEEYVCIDFEGELAGRTVKLHYQKTLGNNKRPDFMLEITTKLNTIFLVLDAKFKNYESQPYAVKDLIEIKEKYAISKNHFVFSLHPCNSIIYYGKAKKDSNYGGEIVDSKKRLDFPHHTYGYVKIKPNELENLKKLIGLGFEYLLEKEQSLELLRGVIDPLPKNDIFCLNCGGDKINLLPQNRGENKFYYVCQCESQDCGHKIYIDYCWNCKTSLFKHGRYWDYHKTSIWSEFDIHCPNCGMTVSDFP